jgi:hypothetical protein
MSAGTKSVVRAIVISVIAGLIVQIIAAKYKSRTAAA